MVRKCIRTVNKIPQTNIVINYWKPEDHNHYFRFMTFINLDGNQNIDYIKKCDYKIYTSKFNKWYLMKYYLIQEDRIVTLEPGEPLTLDDHNKNQTFKVTALDANFCAGSMMFLFQGSFGNILYTGYFRISISTSLWKIPVMKTIIKDKSMDCVYFDNSYAAENCEFPSRAQTVSQIVDLLRQNPNDRVYIFGKRLGREEVLLDIARALNVKIRVSKEKFVLLSQLGIQEHFTIEEQNCRISALDRILKLAECRIIRKDRPTCLFILLTAYHNIENSEINLQKNLPNLHIFPYSGHCCHRELMYFFSIIQPYEIRPILLDSVKGNSSIIPQCMLDLRCRRNKIRNSNCKAQFAIDKETPKKEPTANQTSLRNTISSGKTVEQCHPSMKLRDDDKSTKSTLKNDVFSEPVATQNVSNSKSTNKIVDMVPTEIERVLDIDYPQLSKCTNIFKEKDSNIILNNKVNTIEADLPRVPEEIDSVSLLKIVDVRSLKRNSLSNPQNEVKGLQDRIENGENKDYSAEEIPYITLRNTGRTSKKLQGGIENVECKDSCAEEIPYITLRNKGKTTKKLQGGADNVENKDSSEEDIQYITLRNTGRTSNKLQGRLENAENNDSSVEEIPYITLRNKGKTTRKLQGGAENAENKDYSAEEIPYITRRNTGRTSKKLQGGAANAENKDSSGEEIPYITLRNIGRTSKKLQGGIENVECKDSSAEEIPYLTLRNKGKTSKNVQGGVENVENKDSSAEEIPYITLRNTGRTSKKLQDGIEDVEYKDSSVEEIPYLTVRNKERTLKNTTVTNLSTRTHVESDHDYTVIRESHPHLEFEVDIENQTDFSPNRIGSELNSVHFEVSSDSRVSELTEHITNARLNNFSKEKIVDKLYKPATIRAKVQTDSVNDLHQRCSSVPTQFSKNSINSTAVLNSNSLAVQRVEKRKYASIVDSDDSDSDIECIAILKKSDNNLILSIQETCGNFQNEVDHEKSNQDERTFLNLIKEEDASYVELGKNNNTEINTSLGNSDNGSTPSLKKSQESVSKAQSPQVNFSTAQIPRTNALLSFYNKSNRNKTDNENLHSEIEFHVEGVKVPSNKNINGDQLENYMDVVYNHSISQENCPAINPEDANEAGGIGLNEDDINATAALVTNCRTEEPENEPEITDERLNCLKKSITLEAKQISHKDMFTTIQLFLQKDLAWNIEDLNGCNIFSHPYYK